MSQRLMAEVTQRCAAVREAYARLDFTRAGECIQALRGALAELDTEISSMAVAVVPPEVDTLRAEARMLIAHHGDRIAQLGRLRGFAD